MSNLVPERTINYKVYREGNDVIGVATVELPDIEAMSDTVSGAGIAGEIESPILGHTGSMAMTIQFRQILGDVISLSQQVSHSLQLRSSQQVYDAASGELKSVPVRIDIKGTPKRTGLGSLEVGATTDSEIELELSYLKIYIDNEEKIEIDKYNMKYVVNGVDYLQQVRNDLGM